MKKFIVIFFTGLLMLITGCSEDVVTIEQPIKAYGNKTILVKAQMPNDNPNTRLAMTQNELDVILTWEEGDRIHLVFVDGTTVVQQTVTIGTITNDGRTASFEISLPQEIFNGEGETFDLYGIYGDISFSDEEGEENLAVLPSNPWSGTLSEVQDKEIVLIRFAETAINKEAPDISVNFQHVGSLFKIYLENTGTTPLEEITGVELYSASPIFAHQNASPNVAKYDIITGDFVPNTTDFFNILPFSYTGDLAAEGVLELWGWYSPSQIEGDVWPAINMRVRYGESGVYETPVAKPARTAITAIGRAYHFFARYNSNSGQELVFSTEFGDTFIDERDNEVYNIVQIGSQIWMAENLKYYPSIDDLVNSSVGSATEPHYYVYNYYGIQPPSAEAINNFNNYGVLYNWAAAMNGANSSNTSPSGVQGVCPDGWHLPSVAEWNQLISFVGTNAGSKLKEIGDDYWDVSIDVTNAFGFSARGGGSRQPTGFFNLRINGHWITSTQDVNNENQMEAIWMQSNLGIAGNQQAPKDYAGSIRCVRD